MLRQYELVERVRAYDPDVDEALLNRAYVFTVQKHGSQKRASGDPYFSHPVEVAGLMTDLKLDQETIATALLHDTVEDTLATIADIELNFGPKVARLVDGVTKLSKIEQMPENERAAENLRKFLLAMSEDIRVLLVKLGDRLHNMRTLHFIKNPDKRQRIARETMDIYAPLAERVGMYEYMREMQLLAFEQLEPEAYRTIENRLDQLRALDTGQVDKIALDIKHALAEAGLKVEVTGREKHPYSIWRKMAERHVSFEQVTDIMAFRVITDDEADCYAALGVLHRTWQFLPGKFKDYISTPKTNGYRSLHTSLMYENSMRVEVQIRTREMHRLNEFGLAAHWAYKQGGGSPDGQAGWIRDLLEILDQTHDPDSAAHAAGEWRCGGDHQGQGGRAAIVLAGLRRHRQGARHHPPRSAAEGARRTRRDRPETLSGNRRQGSCQDRQEGARRSARTSRNGRARRSLFRDRFGQDRGQGGDGGAAARLHHRIA